MNKKPSSISDAYRAAAPYLSLGIQFAATIVLCVLAGNWVDGRYDTKPVFTLIGGILGIIVGFYHFLKTVLNQGRKSEEDP